MYRRIQNIQASDNIGDSLIDINENFLALDKRVQDIDNIKTTLHTNLTSLKMIFDEFESFYYKNYFTTKFEARLSTHPLQAFTNSDVSIQYQKDLASIYLHRYKGDTIGLYDGNKWSRCIIPLMTEINLLGRNLSDNTTYDIFINYQNKKIEFVFTKMLERNLQIHDGIITDNNKNRYIGSVHILNGSRTEMSFVNDSNNNLPARQLLWNMYNRLPSQIVCREIYSYTLKRYLSHKNSILPVLKDKPYFWNKTNELRDSSGLSNSVMFVNGQEVSVKMMYRNIVNSNNKNVYLGIGLNEINDPDFYEEVSSTTSNTQAQDTVCMTSYFQKNINAGLNTLTTFDAGEEGTMFNIDGTCQSVTTIYN